MAPNGIPFANLMDTASSFGQEMRPMQCKPPDIHDGRIGHPYFFGQQRRQDQIISGGGAFALR
jgi:hypothetical protein